MWNVLQAPLWLRFLAPKFPYILFLFLCLLASSIQLIQHVNVNYTMDLVSRFSGRISSGSAYCYSSGCSCMFGSKRVSWVISSLFDIAYSWWTSSLLSRTCWQSVPRHVLNFFGISKCISASHWFSCRSPVNGLMLKLAGGFWQRMKLSDRFTIKSKQLDVFRDMLACFVKCSNHILAHKWVRGEQCNKRKRYFDINNVRVFWCSFGWHDIASLFLGQTNHCLTLLPVLRRRYI